MRKSLLIKYINLSVAIIATFITFYLGFSKIFYERSRKDKELFERLDEQQHLYKLRIFDSEHKIELLQAKVDSLIKINDRLKNEQLTLRPDTVINKKSIVDRNYNELLLRVNGIDKQLVEIGKQHTALRQAINPLKPDEVLTIVRLKDEIEKTKKDFITLSDNINLKQVEFKESILRERESSNKSTNIILVVLIPLVLNFLYTVWKDFRDDKYKKKEKQTSPNSV